MMNTGWTQDSKIPRRKRTTISEAKLFDAAEQETTAPQQMTLVLVSIVRHLRAAGLT